MPDNDTPRSAPAFAFNEPVIVPAPEGVDGAISEVMARHQADFDAALEPFGVSLDTLMQATWMRLVTVADVQAAWNGAICPVDAYVDLDHDNHAPPSAPAVDGAYATDQLRDPEPFGERIEEPAVREVHPEPRRDADLFGAPGSPLPLLSDDSARCTAGACSGCAAVDAVAQSIGGEVRDDGKLSPEQGEALGLLDAPASLREQAGFVADVAARARAFQEQADRDGYGR